MRFFVVLACVLVAANALTDEQKEKLKRHQAECFASSGVDVALVQKMRSGDYSSDSQELKKFSLCMLMKTELMTDAGEFRKDVALAKIPVEADRPAVAAIIDECLSQKGATPEESAWSFMKCYHGKNPKHPLL